MFAAEEPAPDASFKQQMFGLHTYAQAAGFTAWGELINRPTEWGRGADGIGKRFASAYARHLVAVPVKVGVARLHHEDLRYFPSEQGSIKGRLAHALLSTVVARNTITGDPTIAAGRISAAFTGGMVSRLWYPEQVSQRFERINRGRALPWL